MPLVRKLEYWVKFKAEDREALLNLPFFFRRVEPHQYLVREFDRAHVTFFLLSGHAVRHKVVSGGERQILAIHIAGEMIDLQNSMLGIADHSVQMLTSGVVAGVPKEEVIRLAFERPAVGHAMWIDTLVEASISREWIANIGRRDARARLCHLLCEFSLRLRVAGLGEPTNYELPMNQEQLANATGMTAVHVNRTLKLLEKEGLIERRSARLIQIGDWRKLADAGDFNSAYLHLKESEPALT